MRAAISPLGVDVLVLMGFGQRELRFVSEDPSG